MDQWQREMKMRQQAWEEESRLRANTAARQQTSGRLVYIDHILLTLSAMLPGASEEHVDRIFVLGVSVQVPQPWIHLFNSLFLSPSTPTFVSAPHE